MKTIVLFLGCFAGVCGYSQSQKNENPKLEWSISLKKNHIVFECFEGCNYSYLSFDSYRKVFLNENAMLNLHNNNEKAENSNFIVQYSKTGNQVNLHGIKGVDWKNITLDFDKTQKYTINQSGEIKQENLNNF